MDTKKQEFLHGRLYTRQEEEVWLATAQGINDAIVDGDNHYLIDGDYVVKVPNISSIQMKNCCRYASLFDTKYSLTDVEAMDLSELRKLFLKVIQRECESNLDEDIRKFWDIEKVYQYITDFDGDVLEIIIKVFSLA